MLFNEIYTPIFEKLKLLKARERSALQLMSVSSRNKNKDIINNFKCNAKTHSTMDKSLFHFILNTSTF